MVPTHTPQYDTDRDTVYQIRLDGHLTDNWSDWFEGLSITLEEGGETLLTGRVADQATLFGLLRKVRDSGLKLLSVTRVESKTNDAE
ncbi:MAG: hypothetical protein IPM16_13060 [Chloroflexi bacterium]|nr:hypothetical protein [Chloroflexota bacterium]